jgi:hypothetical protein
LERVARLIQGVCRNQQRLSQLRAGNRALVGGCRADFKFSSPKFSQIGRGVIATLSKFLTSVVLRGGLLGQMSRCSTNQERHHDLWELELDPANNDQK